MLILLIAMSSFAQMLVTLTYEPKTSANAEKEGDLGHFLSETSNSYIKAYTIMLGDFEADSLTTHPSITLLFISYTFGVTVVLLNILIAIVSESYDASLVSSKTMLSQARMVFCSELSSLFVFYRRLLKGDFVRQERMLLAVLSSISLWITTEFIRTTQEHRSIAYTDLWNGNFFGVVLLVICGGILVLMENITIHVHQHFDYAGIKGTPEGKVHSTLDLYIQRIVKVASGWADYLGGDDDDDEHLVRESHLPGDNSGKNGGGGNGVTEIRQIMRSTKRELDAEIHKVSERVGHDVALAETETKDMLTSLEERINTRLDNNQREIAALIREAVQNALIGKS